LTVNYRGARGVEKATLKIYSCREELLLRIMEESRHSSKEKEGDKSPDPERS